MKGFLKRASGYQDDHMNLPVGNLDAAIPFYETVLGFSVLSRAESPHRRATLGRDDVQLGLAENGGDPAQDGCAFHVENLAALADEFKARGLQKELSSFGTEEHGGSSFKVFYVVAPDGLCYWFGERQPDASVS
jgi:catechol 2,3-dioxygenase-like lactoylglutathione lyase family enzyme